MTLEKKKKILFVAEAVTLAHVGRILSLASLLSSDKYDVMLAFDSRFDRFIGKLPFAKTELKTIASEQFVQKLARGANPYTAEVLKEYVIEDLSLFNSFKPDVVVGDFRLSLMVSARVKKIPYVNLINAHWSPCAKPKWIAPTNYYFKKLGVVGILLSQFVFKFARPLFFKQFAKEFRRWIAHYNLNITAKELPEIYCEADYVLYPDIKEIIEIDKLPENHFYLGPLTWSPSVKPPLWWQQVVKNKNQDVVFVSLGSSGDSTLVPQIIQVLADKNITLIVSTLGKIKEQSLPTNIFLAPMLSLAEVANIADLIVCNGGSGSINQCLQSGVPVIGIADNLDQFLCMSFAERSGFAKLLRSDSLNGKKIESAIFSVLKENKYKVQAQKLKVLANSYDQARIFNELIEKICASTQVGHEKQDSALDDAPESQPATVKDNARVS